MDYSDGSAFTVPADLLAQVRREGHELVMERARELEAAALLENAKPADTTPEAETTPAESSAAAPAACPHCGARLSALDLKFGNCMGCGKSLAAPDASVQSARVEVRI